MVEQDTAPAGVPRKARTRAASELRPAANTGCPPGAWLTADKHGVLNPRKARPMPEEERRDGAPGRRPRSREGARHKRTMVAPPGAPSPSHLRGVRKGTTAYPAPQRTRVLTLALTKAGNSCPGRSAARLWCAADPGPSQIRRLVWPRISGAPLRAAPRRGHAGADSRNTM